MLDWISTKKELPDEGVRVLICAKDWDDGQHFDVAYFVGASSSLERHWEDGGSSLYWPYMVTHWARINAPEPEDEGDV
jgi:hypothetical protein